ncbi:glycosyltransferase [Chryseobacterium indologenes]|uniref:glycosyltransferase n=1 Tax=Chryseobacterium TaxID=59732 RepID=UPI0003E080C4|nr:MULTISPECIES: glycosyltransferase [Chryseobacterium]ATN07545.1 glycosyltransferase [Chryseobacterium indologenes]AVK73290.1 glycosyltransferase [Chryseobacterium indologenes]AYZ37530.1 glycosyltransferase [Chryseobacterium indologenes]MBF6646403.1 glycosyltransferase [Chryseobacterium indologenes]MBU3049543.1 glycosyltransferase [Chryseobacterium indologenes]
MAEKKKILIRIGSLRHGGAEKVLINFLKNLPEDKYEVDLLINLYTGMYIKEVPSWVNLHYLIKGEMITTNRPHEIPVKAFRVLYQKMFLMFPSLLYTFVLKNKKYDVEIAAIHGMYRELLSSPQKDSKKIIWIQNDIFNLKEYTPDIIRQFFKFDRILVISNKLKEEMQKLAASDKEKQSVIKIFNPIDREDTLQKANMEIKDFPFSGELPTFITIGTVYPQKGYDRLLDVHKKLMDEGLKHQIIIIGDGFDFENIQSKLNQLGVQETVKMLGFRSNPYPYLKQSDFYVMSSRHEGFPTIIAEALILNKPVVSTDVSGIKDLLQDGKLGIITPNSEDGIYEGMKKFLTEKGLAGQYEKEIANTDLPFVLQKSVAYLQEIIDEV